ncbi:NUDIX domain-containing protein [Brevibacillus sp. SYSU BS000544]|uniref:NUDIX domain-containing protein n=1 Tax=Brevibacillus sp. SYSU BS000544 TaxID=3416443 RepID=UPI003CE59514
MKTPKIVVTAGAIIRDAEGRVLLQKRSDDGKWGFPGGALEPGETIEQAMLREVWEETGLTLQDYRFYTVYSGPRMNYIYPDGNHVTFIMFIFEATFDFTGLLEGSTLPFQDQNNESLCLRLFHLEEITPDMITEANIPVLIDLQQNNCTLLRS